MKPLLLIAFMAVATRCIQKGDVEMSLQHGPIFAPTIPECFDEVYLFTTKNELVEFLKQQDPKVLPNHRAYEVKPLEYTVEVELEKRKHTEEVEDIVEVKREVKFK